MSFKPDMIWGAATASYQIEGAWNEDGKGLSVWDQMARWPGKVKHGNTGDVACDHYHRYGEDIRIMQDIGLDAYRFSLSWPRILPAGDGAVNQAGLDFYNRLVDALLEANVTPWITLFHWDYPLDLHHRGGWMNPRSSDWFADYAEVVVKSLGDRVTNWITHNEPQIFIGVGHEIGRHAPGMVHAKPDVVRMVHNALLAHGKACQKIREHVEDAKIGWATANGAFRIEKAYEKDAEVVAHAQKKLFSFDALPTEFMSFNPALWNDPACLGEYPEGYLRVHGQHLPAGWEQDLETIHQPLDFSGLNVYQSGEQYYRNEAGEIAVRGASEYGLGYPRTHIDWPITPESLYWAPRSFFERYGLPICILENGLSGHDWVHADGQCHDPHRIDFLTQYLSELRRAAADGVDVAAYFQWSLLDNYEWAEGYDHRFGLVHVDFNTLQRTPKDSSRWYADVIKSNGTNF